MFVCLFVYLCARTGVLMMCKQENRIPWKLIWLIKMLCSLWPSDNAKWIGEWKQYNTYTIPLTNTKKTRVAELQFILHKCQMSEGKTLFYNCRSCSLFINSFIYLSFDLLAHLVLCPIKYFFFLIFLNHF